MGWKENCFTALDAERMFEDSGHRTRFKELVDCFSAYPFFSKGLCKCIYMSAWDEEHFCIMLETLTDLSLGRETDTKEMRVKGDALTEEQTDSQYYVYELSNAFLDGRDFQLDADADIAPAERYIISRSLAAAKIIDML